MKDFNSFKPDDNNNNNPKGSDFNKDTKQSAMDMVKNIAQKFHGKTEGELMDAIFEEALKGRKSGTLTDAELDKFAATLKPFLDKEKQQKLQEIILRLKNQT